MELFAVRQYMQQHYTLAPTHKKVAKELKDIAITEMEHCELLAERIVQLGGDPTSIIAQEIRHNQSLAQALLFNRNLEKKTIRQYIRFRDKCRFYEDVVSEKIFSKLIYDEEKHFEEFEKLRGK